MIYFFEVMTDSDGCSVNAFWILIFGPLITIDSNGRTIIFACSLLYTEAERSFEWVFSTFEEAFHHTPKMIITD